MSFSTGKKVLLFVLLGSITLFFTSDLHQYLSLPYLKSELEAIKDIHRIYPWLSMMTYLIGYICMTALSLPGATVLTLMAGAIFGLIKGSIIVSFASTIGATIAFLISRYLLRDYVDKKFKKTILIINNEIEKKGGYYLFSIRLLPLFPFFLINLAMGLTKIRTTTFFLISQLGMIPGTIIYVNAGVELSKISNPSDILSKKILFSFILIGIFPFVIRQILNFYQKKKIYSRFKKPKKFDYNMIVIGGGSAGLVTSYICAAVKAKVALIEKSKMGGDCLNYGCVPSKAIIKTSKVLYQIKNAQKYGLNATEPEFEFKNVMKRVHETISKIEPHDSIKRYEELGVKCYQGSAKIISPWEVKINDTILTTRNITIATGAKPTIPKINGIELIQPLTSENLWQLKNLPSRFIIVGGGPIGTEMAQAFQRLGSQVTIIERGSHILAQEDTDVASYIEEKLKDEGVRIFKNCEIQSITKSDGVNSVILNTEEKIDFDEILFAIGRSPNTKGFGLEELGVELRSNNSINANDFLETNFSNIFVCGDVTGPYQLTHTAAHQAWYCAVNALFGTFKKFKVNYDVIPWATFTDPEVATVGLTEKNAIKNEIAYEVTKYEIDDLDRAIADSENHGFVKVLTRPGSDKILGATIVGHSSPEMITEFISAMKNGHGLNKILGTIHIYPTLSEANKYLAGQWKKKTTSNSILKLLEKYHRYKLF